MADEFCGFCALPHEEGSADWRDCQQKQFEKLATSPDDWQFTITEDQRLRVRAAHVELTTDYPGTVPDIQLMRTMLSRQSTIKDEDGADIIDVPAMTKFWTDFSDDRPAILKRHGNLQHSLDAMWSERKIFKILDNENLHYIQWETEDVSAHLNSPSTLRVAADKMEEYEAAGYELYHREVINEHICEWSFRRGKVKNKKTQESAP